MNRFWKWYNGLKEPKRFFMAMLMLSPLYFSPLVMRTNLWLTIIMLLSSFVLILSKEYSERTQ
jgi:hypothetical protein